MLLVIEPKKVRFSTYKDFKSKIRLSIIGVLIFSLIGVGSISIYFVVKQYKNKNYETIDEKLQSVYMELESNLGRRIQSTLTGTHLNTAILKNFCENYPMYLYGHKSLRC